MLFILLKVDCKMNVYNDQLKWFGLKKKIFSSNNFMHFNIYGTCKLRDLRKKQFLNGRINNLSIVYCFSRFSRKMNMPIHIMASRIVFK